MRIVLILVGLLLGLLFGAGSGALLGTAVGALAGYLLGEISALRRRAQDLEDEVANLRRAARSAAADARVAARNPLADADAEAPRTAARAYGPESRGESAERSAEGTYDAGYDSDPAGAEPRSQPFERPPLRPASEVEAHSAAGTPTADAQPSYSGASGARASGNAFERTRSYGGAEPPVEDQDTLTRTVTAIREYFTGGNTLVRAGVVILFIGVAFLLRYIAEHTNVPIQLRLAGVALGGVVLLALGWRLRKKRPG